MIGRKSGKDLPEYGFFFYGLFDGRRVKWMRKFEPD